MANNLLTIDMIMNKSLEMFENELVLTRTCNRQYDDAFAQKGAKIGASVRARLPDRCLVTDGPALQVQDDDEQYVNITLTSQKHVGLNFTSSEMTLSLDDFAERVLKPRISQLAASVDNDVANVYKSFYNTVGTPGTTPATSLVLLQAQQKLNEQGVPVSPRFLGINPAANAGLVEGMKSLFNPNTKISSQFNNGNVANGILGYDEVNMTQSIKVHTTGSRSTSDTILVNGAVSTQGTSTISLDGGTGSATIVEGDVFTIAGVYSVNPQTRESTGSLQQFVCTATNTASSGAWTSVAISPPIYTATHALATVDAFPADNATVTFVGAASTQYPQNLSYWRDSFTFVTADLVLPEKAEIAMRKQYNGISLRIVKNYDINSDAFPCRLDVLYGYKALRPAAATRVWG